MAWSISEGRPWYQFRARLAEFELRLRRRHPQKRFCLVGALQRVSTDTAVEGLGSLEGVFGNHDASLGRLQGARARAVPSWRTRHMYSASFSASLACANAIWAWASCRLELAQVIQRLLGSQ